MNMNTIATMSMNRMNNSQQLMMKSMERLTTGKRINSASDDPAGLAISEKMRAQIRGLEQANRNGQDGMSLLQTAENGLEVGHEILQQLNEMAVQASNETLGGEEREAIAKGISDLLESLDKIGHDSTFNGRSLLDGTLDIKLTTDANGGTMDVAIGAMTSTALGGTNRLDSFYEGGANATMTRENALLLKRSTETAINEISSSRSNIGAKQNRMTHIMNYNATASANLQTAESRIRNVDEAKEVMNLAKQQMISQMSQAMFQQANQNSYQVLELLK